MSLNQIGVIMKIVICIFSLVSFLSLAREGKTVMQERAERAKERERCIPYCRVVCAPVIYAMEQKSDHITDEQRDLMREHGLSVPPTILGRQREEKIATPIFSAAEPVREIKIDEVEQKANEALLKKDPPKAEIVEDKTIADVAKKVDNGPTQEQRDLMRDHGLSVPPTILESNAVMIKKSLPDIANEPKQTAIQAATKAIVEELSDGTFKPKISSGCCLVVFGTKWCAPCRRLEPALSLIAEKYDSKNSTLHVSVFHIDVEDCPQTKSSQRISVFPTMILYHDGIRVDSRTGFMERDAIEAWLNKYK